MRLIRTSLSLGLVLLLSASWPGLAGAQEPTHEAGAAHHAGVRRPTVPTHVSSYRISPELALWPYTSTLAGSKGPHPIWGSRRFGNFLYRAGNVGKKMLNMTTVRVGLNLGATAPLRVPEGTSIRAFAPIFAPMLALEQYIGLTSWMGCVTGLYAEYKGMKTTALVANFYTKVSMTENNVVGSFSGSFTGTNRTEVNCAYLGIPLRLAFTLTPRYQLQLGGYVAYALYKSFKGSVSNGYIWSEPPEPGGVSDRKQIPEAPFDFSSDIQDFDAGVALFGLHGLSRHLVLSAGVSMSLLNLFKKHFEGISMRMQHVYLNVAMGYCFTGLFKE